MDSVGEITNPKQRSERGLGGVNKDTVNFFNWVQSDNPGFLTFLRRLHRLPYNNQISIVQHRVDYIIRFENLQSDFSELLKRLDIEQKRPIPSTNKTQKKDGNSFLDYYTPETYEYAKRIFGPFMQKWDYNFPPEWGHVNIPWWSQTEFNILSVFRRFYWGYIRTNSSTGIRNFGNKVKGMLKSKYT
jgi:hypothetical protein